MELSVVPQACTQVHYMSYTITSSLCSTLVPVKARRPRARTPRQVSGSLPGPNLRHGGTSEKLCGAARNGTERGGVFVGPVVRFSVRIVQGASSPLGFWKCHRSGCDPDGTQRSPLSSGESWPDPTVPLFFSSPTCPPELQLLQEGSSA